MRVEKRPTDFTGGYAAYAVDPEAERLWKRSHTLMRACDEVPRATLKQLVSRMADPTPDGFQ